LGRERVTTKIKSYHRGRSKRRRRGDREIKGRIRRSTPRRRIVRVKISKLRLRGTRRKKGKGIYNPKKLVKELRKKSGRNDCGQKADKRTERRMSNAYSY